MNRASLPRLPHLPPREDVLGRHLAHPRAGWAFGWSERDVAYFQQYTVTHMVRPGYLILGGTSLVIWLVMVVVMRAMRKRHVRPSFRQRALRTFMFWHVVLWMYFYERTVAHLLPLIWDGWAQIVVIFMALATAVVVMIAYLKKFLYDPFRAAPSEHYRRRISIPMDEVV